MGKEGIGGQTMRKAIAIDFDGCLCTEAFPEIGEPNWPVIQRAKQEQQAGAGLILWTVREGRLLQAEGRPSEYWDDRAVRLVAMPFNRYATSSPQDWADHIWRRFNSAP